MKVTQNKFNQSQISFNPQPNNVDSKEKIVPAFGGANSIQAIQIGTFNLPGAQPLRKPAQQRHILGAKLK